MVKTAVKKLEEILAKWAENFLRSGAIPGIPADLRV